MTRPGRLILAVGTSTEIGKTWVGVETLRAIRARQPGLVVSARKPVQSYESDEADRGVTDADLLAGVTGESPTAVCPAQRWYGVPMAPPMAAEALGKQPFSVADLIGELAWPDEPAANLGWVETVGGPRSPMAEDGDAVTFAAVIDPDEVVLIADAGLGTVNAVILSAAPLSHWPVTVILNRFDPTMQLHQLNVDWLRTREGLEVVTDPEALALVLLNR